MPRSLALVLVALAVAATLWLLGMFGGGAVSNAPAPSTSPSATSPAVAESAKAAQAVDAAASPQRVAVAADSAAGGIALVGKVQDDAGVAIAGAIVACTPALAESASADAADFDMRSMLEHLRATQGLQVEVATDAQGRFRLAPRGTSTTVDLRVRARGHVVLERPAQRPTTGDVDLGALTLERGAQVSGRVVDRQGQPIQGAHVAQITKVEAQFTNMAADMGAGLSGLDDLETPGEAELERLRNGDNGVSDAAGRFVIDHVEPGELSLRARHPDHPSTRLQGLTVAAGKTLADVTIVLEAGGAIRGEVVGGAGVVGLVVQCSEKPADNAAATGFMSVLGGDMGEFLADAGMNFGARSVEVGDDHHFTLRGLHLGRTYRVWVSQTGRGFTGSSPCSERLELPAGSTGVELHFDAGISVTCRVVAAATGAPLERLQVQDHLHGGGGFGDMMSAFAPGRQGVRAYPDGRVTIANLRPKKQQTLTVAIEAIGFARLERSGIALPAAGNLDLGTLQLEAAPVLHVTVVARATGKPVAGAAVRLRDVDGTDATAPRFDRMSEGLRAGKTDAKGRCDLNAPAEEEVVVAVSSREHAPYSSEPIEVPMSGDCEHRVELTAGGTVDVDVAEVDGTPVAGANVEHAGVGVAPAESMTVQHKTDAKGHFVFDRLAAGRHEFRIGAASKNPFEASMQSFRQGLDDQDRAAAGWQAVELDADGVATLTLTRKATATLRGVVREHGAVLAGARVAFVAGPTGDAAEDAPQQAMLAAMGDLAGGSSHSGKTGEDGGYQLTDLPVGAHRLRISHKERSMPTITAITLAAGSNTVDVDLELTLVRGTVRDPQGGPVAGAKITVRAVPAAGADAGEAGLDAMESMMPGMNLGGGGRVVKSGDDGAYELRGVQSGIRLQVRATAKGFAPATSAAFEAAPGATVDAVDLQLGAAGRVKVTLADAPAFSAVTATFVVAEGAQHAPVAPVMQLLKKGVATLDGLCPGRWKIEIAGPDMKERDPRVVDVVAGETATVDF